MADITGKNSSEITAVNVRRHIKRAAKQRVQDELKAAAAKVVVRHDAEASTEIQQ